MIHTRFKCYSQCFTDMICVVVGSVPRVDLEPYQHHAAPLPTTSQTHLHGPCLIAPPLHHVKSSQVACTTSCLRINTMHSEINGKLEKEPTTFIIIYLSICSGRPESAQGPRQHLIVSPTRPSRTCGSARHVHDHAHDASREKYCPNSRRLRVCRQAQCLGTGVAQTFTSKQTPKQSLFNKCKSILLQSPGLLYMYR